MALSEISRNIQDTMLTDVDDILKAEEEARKLMTESINEVQPGGPVVLTQGNIYKYILIDILQFYNTLLMLRINLVDFQILCGHN